MFELGTDGPLVIMAGVDGSESSVRAAAYAAGLARRQGAKLALVFIQPYPASVSASAASEMIAAGRATAEDLRRQMEEAIERLPVGTVARWEFYTGEGDPFRGLCDFAVKLRADAVVIGASQKTGHRIVGSVAVRLVKAGKWPVTVVP
ncbi:UspA domain protein [Catenulispora acidiphila DSM 44928]|uniref:UspA domain protein n=1 Tax=Catenulispora acidiphila (strain DSM 44928 / JCM 14897 / NBRC 102108 / NRRL B-24433 / ID139908) TaxID=479433 RepID=C7Q6A9_CATAD|nr:universal stress protein [Catenulispora acidiphila]ACU72115.1 UspA domain protein [Catenulispora acidiphila DSM 44928]